MVTSSPIRTTTVEIHSGDQTIPAYLATPEGAGPFPAVVVIQEVFGVNAHIREVANRLAQAGYVAIAPHIYHRQAPSFEVGYSDAELALGRQYKEGTQAQELLADIQGSIQYVYHQPQVKQGGVGCIGFCFGGHVAYLAATLPEVKATASFYGAGIVSMTPGGGAPTLTRTPDIGGVIYCFFGTLDPLIPLPEVDQVETELTRHGISHKIFRYSEANHGFFCDRRSTYQPAAAEDAWEKVMELFRDNL